MAQPQQEAEPVLLDPVVVTGTRPEHRLSDSPAESRRSANGAFV